MWVCECEYMSLSIWVWVCECEYASMRVWVYGKHAPGATCLTKLSGAFLKKCAL